MNESTNKTYTADEFKNICIDVIPHLKEIIKTIRENGVGGYISITIDANGHINMEGGGFNGWELLKFNDDIAYTAQYSYREQFTINEECWQCLEKE